MDTDSTLNLTVSGLRMARHRGHVFTFHTHRGTDKGQRGHPLEADVKRQNLPPFPRTGNSLLSCHPFRRRHRQSRRIPHRVFSVVRVEGTLRSVIHLVLGLRSVVSSAHSPSRYPRPIRRHPQNHDHRQAQPLRHHLDRGQRLRNSDYIRNNNRFTLP